MDRSYREGTLDNHGALVGWTHIDNADRIMLRIESVQSSDQVERRDPDLFRVLMSKQQALVLGNYLIQVSGERPVHYRQRGWLRRLFG